jgi:hypothetical protein
MIFQAIPTAERKETLQKLEELKNKMATEMSESHSAHVIGATGGAIPTMAAADSNKIPLENSDFSNSPLDKRLLSRGMYIITLLSFINSFSKCSVEGLGFYWYEIISDLSFYDRLQGQPVKYSLL